MTKEEFKEFLSEMAPFLIQLGKFESITLLEPGDEVPPSVMFIMPKPRNKKET